MSHTINLRPSTVAASIELISYGQWAVLADDGSKRVRVHVNEQDLEFLVRDGIRALKIHRDRQVQRVRSIAAEASS